MKSNSKCKIQNAKLMNLRIYNSQEGIVLVVSLLLLLVATVVGITALSTSTTNVMMTGNQLLSERAFAAADSGIFVSVPIINDAAYYGVVDNIYQGGAPPLVPDPADFVDEIDGASGGDCPVGSPTCAAPAPDIQYTLGAGPSAITVSVDVDHLYAALAVGSAIEFASSFDGIGQGSGGGGAEIYYGVTAVAQGSVGSETSVCALYRYVTK